MENLEKEKTPQEWEIGVLETVAAGNELQLLEMTQDCVIRLANELCDLKAEIITDGKISEYERKYIQLRIARVLVVLDAMQLRYGDCSAYEMEFLQGLEELLRRNKIARCLTG